MECPNFKNKEYHDRDKKCWRVILRFRLATSNKTTAAAKSCSDMLLTHGAPVHSIL